MSNAWANITRTNYRQYRHNRKLVLIRDRGRCQLRLPGCTTIATHADHIVPREIAGDSLDNMRAACASCNLKRGNPRREDPRPRVRNAQW